MSDLTPDEIARCNARGVTEVLRVTPVREMVAGDEYVRPESMYGLPLAYGTNMAGYATLRVDSGKRYRVVSNDGKVFRCEHGGETFAHDIPEYGNPTLLKVERVPTWA